MDEKAMYQPVTREIVKELQAIVGENNLIFDDPDLLQNYSHDEVAGPQYARMPEAVVKPASAREISEIMKIANRHRVPVTPRGGGTGLSCGAVPLCGGIVLALERMNRILEIDRENMVAVVEPGVVTSEIGKAVQEFGLFYAGYPMSFESCFIGGNLAENAGGGRAIKYGVTGHYVLGLEAVLPTGEIVEMGGKRLKDVTGYDLIHLLVGSEGTLGIFTKITLRLLPRPAATAVLLIPFGSASEAVEAFPRVIADAGILPTSIEFMDRLSVETVYRFLGENPPRPDIGAMLLIELDGSSREKVDEESQKIGELFLQIGRPRCLRGQHAHDGEKDVGPTRESRRGLQDGLSRAEPRGHRGPHGTDPRSHPRAGAPGAEVRHPDSLLRPRRRRQPSRNPRQEAGNTDGGLEGEAPPHPHGALRDRLSPRAGPSAASTASARSGPPTCPSS